MTEHAAKRSAAPPSLKDAAWLQQAETKRVFAALAGPGIETRAVGGAVRNTLLGLPVAEVDLATTALPEKVIALARGADLKAVPTGIEHGTVTVVANGVALRGDDAPARRRDLRQTCDRRFHGRLGRRCAAPRLHAERALCRKRRGTVRSAGRLCRSCRRPRAVHRRCESAHQGGLSPHPALLPLQRLLRQGPARRSRACCLRAAPRRSRSAFGGTCSRRATQAARRASSGPRRRGAVRLRAADPVARRRAAFAALRQDWLPRKRRWGFRPTRRSGWRRSPCS